MRKDDPSAVSGRRRPFFEDDGGFTTVGMVLAMLLTLSLLFSTAQVYRIQTSSAQVQNVADVSALAAQNTVAEFYVVAAVCDAIVLSFTIAGVAVTGVGLVALCVPPLSGLGANLTQAGRTVFESRDAFVEKATKGLDSLQRAIPFLSAASALGVMRANSDGLESYAGYVVLAPSEGEEISFDGVRGAQEALDGVSESEEEIARASAAAEEAAEEALREKAAGYEADCGGYPGYCMYERASSLAGLSGTSNPYYGSVDAWSFSVGLERARAYYAARAASEVPQGGSVAEQARSALRSRFYRFACEELGKARIVETDAVFDVSLPLLPCTPEEVASTALQTEEAYPVTSSDGVPCMHAWPGCPGAAGATRTGSIAELSEGGFEVCGLCGFEASSMGRVAAASTSIDNGFEHHWRRFKEAAEAYERARDVSDPLKEQVRSMVEESLDGFSEVLASVASERIEVSPPGRLGVVAIVADVSRTPADAGFESGFVSGGGSLGTRVAVSASVLVEQGAEEGENVLSSLLDGVEGRLGPAPAVEGASIVLGLWSAALDAYTQGFAAVESGLESVLSSLPLSCASGLGSWASDALVSFVESAGLQPAELGAPKPVVVNTAHVASADDSPFSQAYSQAQREAVSEPGSSAGSLPSAFAGLDASLVEGKGSLGTSFEIARVELFGSGGPAVWIDFAVPGQAVGTDAGLLSSAVSLLKGLSGSSAGKEQWR